MSSSLEQQCPADYDVRKLPDWTPEEHSRALELVTRISERNLFGYVCEFVRNATSIREIIDFFEEVLADTRDRLALIFIPGISRTSLPN